MEVYAIQAARRHGPTGRIMQIQLEVRESASLIPVLIKFSDRPEAKSKMGGKDEGIKQQERKYQMRAQQKRGVTLRLELRPQKKLGL